LLPRVCVFLPLRLQVCWCVPGLKCPGSFGPVHSIFCPALGWYTPQDIGLLLIVRGEPLSGALFGRPFSPPLATGLFANGYEGLRFRSHAILESSLHFVVVVSESKVPLSKSRINFFLSLRAPNPVFPRHFFPYLIPLHTDPRNLLFISSLPPFPRRHSLRFSLPRYFVPRAGRTLKPFLPDLAFFGFKGRTSEYSFQVSLPVSFIPRLDGLLWGYVFLGRLPCLFFFWVSRAFPMRCRSLLFYVCPPPFHSRPFWPTLPCHLPFPKPYFTTSLKQFLDASVTGELNRA